MIDLERLHPPRGHNPETYPLLTPEALQQILREKIDYIVAQLHKPKRPRTDDERKIRQLVNIKGGDTFSLITDVIYTRVGTIDHSTLQTTAYALMQEYGLDPNINILTDTIIGDNHVTREIHHFPSQTIPGLVFQRMYDYDPEGPIMLMWHVEDQGPLRKKRQRSK